MPEDGFRPEITLYSEIGKADGLCVGFSFAGERVLLVLSTETQDYYD